MRLENRNVERWKAIPGWEGFYEVSNHGRVRSLDRTVVHRNGKVCRYKGRLRAQARDEDGYLQVLLSRPGLKRQTKVHALVLSAFVGPMPDDMQVCHNDGNVANNKLLNLRYGTGAENCADTLRHGNRPLGEHHKRSKLTDEQIQQIRELRGRCSQKELADRFGVHRVHISNIQRGIYWQHV